MCQANIPHGVRRKGGRLSWDTEVQPGTGPLWTLSKDSFQAAELVSPQPRTSSFCTEQASFSPPRGTCDPPPSPCLPCLYLPPAIISWPAACLPPLTGCYQGGIQGPVFSDLHERSSTPSPGTTVLRSDSCPSHWPLVQLPLALQSQHVEDREVSGRGLKGMVFLSISLLGLSQAPNLESLDSQLLLALSAHSAAK